jgi:hypothetical protein
MGTNAACAARFIERMEARADTSAEGMEFYFKQSQCRNDGHKDPRILN